MTGILTALTEGELKIMELLWERGGLSSWEISFGLSKNNPVSESMVRTVMRVLTDKGYVQIQSEGGVDTYSAMIAPEDARAQVVKYLLQRFFHDSPALLIQDLVANDELDSAECRRLMDELTCAVA